VGGLRIIMHRVKKLLKKTKSSFRLPLLTALYWLIALQVLDAGFTALGVYLHGTEAEGNIIIKTLIENFGLLVLIPVKLFAIFLICIIIKSRHGFGIIEKTTMYLIFIFYYIVVISWPLILAFVYK